MLNGCLFCPYATERYCIAITEDADTWEIICDKVEGNFTVKNGEAYKHCPLTDEQRLKACN